jgi:hypothetical protein
MRKFESFPWASASARLVGGKVVGEMAILHFGTLESYSPNSEIACKKSACAFFN